MTGKELLSMLVRLRGELLYSGRTESAATDTLREFNGEVDRWSTEVAAIYRRYADTIRFSLFNPNGLYANMVPQVAKEVMTLDLEEMAANGVKAPDPRGISGETPQQGMPPLGDTEAGDGER